MSDDLIKWLRNTAFNIPRCAEVADLIEQQAARIAELATDLERTRQDRNSAHVQARREISKEHRDYIAKLKAKIAALESAEKEAVPIYQVFMRGLKVFVDTTKEVYENNLRTCPEDVRVVYRAPASKDVIRREAWQPIDTAPKDGTSVLLIATRHSMLMPHPEMIVGAYRNGWWSGPSTISHVTHWMPLPEAPAALSQKVGDQK